MRNRACPVPARALSRGEPLPRCRALPDSRLPEDQPVPAAVSAPADKAELGPLARAAADAAVGSAWAFFTRTAAQGLDWDDIHGCASQADYRARLAAEPGLLLETCQALIDYDTGLTERERSDCRRMVALADALALRHPAGPAPVPASLEPAAVPLRQPAALAEPISPAVAASGEPAPRRRLGLWLGAGLVLLGTGAALAWLWGLQPRSAKPGRHDVRPALASQPAPTGLPPTPVVNGANAEATRPPAPARPGPTATPTAAPKPASAAVPASRPASPAPTAEARPAATATPAPTVTPASAPAPAPPPAQPKPAAPQPIASGG